MSKVMSVKEAVERFVSDGAFVYIGGYICRPPFSAIHEIIIQNW